MKTALITGSNKGIGFETARQLGKKGFHVIISGRNEKKLQEAIKKLESENILCAALLMDINDAEKINTAATVFQKMNIELDVLINNAAILLKEDLALSNQNEKILFDTLQTNCFGLVRVVYAFLPYMKTHSRIINISSGGGSLTDPVGGWAPAYCVSKTLVNSITRQLAHELSPKKISVNAVCPGWVRTDMGGEGAARPVEKGAETPVWLAVEASEKFTGMFFRDKKEIPW
ncbi:MAG: SDR family NAD(P)-dependent oxidoreductase [Flavobacteriales bacterium]